MKFVKIKIIEIKLVTARTNNDKINDSFYGQEGGTQGYEIPLPTSILTHISTSHCQIHLTSRYPFPIFTNILSPTAKSNISLQHNNNKTTTKQQKNNQETQQHQNNNDNNNNTTQQQ